MKLKEKVVTLEEYNKNKSKYYEMCYTTIRRKGRGCGLYDPSMYSRGSLPMFNLMTPMKLLKLLRNHPKRKIKLLGDDGETVAIVQVRNIRMLVEEKVK